MKRLVRQTRPPENSLLTPCQEAAGRVYREETKVVVITGGSRVYTFKSLFLFTKNYFHLSTLKVKSIKISTTIDIFYYYYYYIR